MAQRDAPTTSLIESDRIEGTPVYSAEDTQVGTIKRLIMDRASGRALYAVIAFAPSLGLEDVPYVIPWTRLSYDRERGRYRSAIAEAELRGAASIACGDVDWADAASLDALDEYFMIPSGWRSI